MKPKFVVNYTKNIGYSKGGKFDGYHRQGFLVREDALKWVVDNKEMIYWSQVVEVDAASKHPKAIVEEIPDPLHWDRFEGTLQTFNETGMECLGLVLQCDEPHGDANPDFDPAKPETGSNFRWYSSYDALHFIEKNTILEIDGVRYAMIKDSEFAEADAYNLSFYPAGFSKKELLTLFIPENKLATLYVKKKTK